MRPGGRGYIRTDFPHKHRKGILDLWKGEVQGERKKREWKEGWEEGRKKGRRMGGSGEEGRKGRRMEGRGEGEREGGKARWDPTTWCQLSCGIPAVTPVHNQMGTAPLEMQFRA